MKKIAIFLAITLFAPAVLTLSAGAKAASDLAVGDPMGKGGTMTTHHHRHHHKKSTTTGTEAAPATEKAPAAKPAAEKAPEKPAEPAK